ncbi:hypothetical protein [Nocardia asiatica]
MSAAEFGLQMATHAAGSALKALDSLDSELRQLQNYLRPLAATPGLAADSVYWESEGVADPVELVRSVLAQAAAIRHQLDDLDPELLAVRKLIKQLNIDPEPGEGVGL